MMKEELVEMSQLVVTGRDIEFLGCYKEMSFDMTIYNCVANS